MTGSATKTNRKIVKIDEEKCDGCGLCIISCAEGSLKIIDGKAKLISEVYCDGLGACLGECPQDAISIEERVAAEFDEEAVKHHLQKKPVEENLPCGCSSAMVTQFEGQVAEEAVSGDKISRESMLGHWPVQLTLVPPNAPFLQGADMVLAADCVPFAYASFHEDFLKGNALLVACPKLDDYQEHLAKLTDIFCQSDIRSVKVVHMEVPCCSGIVHLAEQAKAASGKNLPLEDVTITVRGDCGGGSGSGC